MKKTVKYHQDKEHSIIEGFGAWVWSIDHPETLKDKGVTIVRTSRVIRVEKDGVFETLNTIYEPLIDTK